MTDIKLVYRNIEGATDLGIIDISPDGAGLEVDDGLETAVIISLFSDRRANDDDELPSGDDRRGWWADTYADVDGDKIGSRLWLLGREKQLPGVVGKAKEYAEEALKWLVDDGIAEKVSVAAEIVQKGMLGLSAEIKRPGVAPVKYRFNYVWEAM
ncbi:GP46 family protein [uncultured Desulfobacterium sp.]|uniref:GP46 family protein n=1 Tax=uncultured Desulfobacterium sp. TaxID=201089 RepID=A0A445MWF7_9BACT|nr:GP46 family protein [uncultured Desulfobacterium sp.]